VASTAVGTGSGAIPIMVQMIKSRFKEKPVYALIVLPFEHEADIDVTSDVNSGHETFHAASSPA